MKAPKTLFTSLTLVAVLTVGIGSCGCKPVGRAISKSLMKRAVKTGIKKALRHELNKRELRRGRTTPFRYTRNRPMPARFRASLRSRR